MQDFINHAAVNRAAAEVFAGARARYYLFGLAACAVLFVAGAAPAAVWLGVTLLVDAARACFMREAKKLTQAQARTATLALDIVGAATLAIAPVLVWYSGAALSGAAATALLAVFVADAALRSQHGRLHLIVTCAPYALVGLTLLVEAGSASAFGAAVAVALAILYLLAAIMNERHRADHARLQDAESVRQENMSLGEQPSARWEIDFEQQRLVGAGRLAGVIGRPVCYSDVVDRALFAPTQDRALVAAAFRPAHGPPRRITLEHGVAHADGTVANVRHDAFLRTSPDGTPIRLTCTTSQAAASAGVIPDDCQHDARAALASQAEALRTLGCELAQDLGVSAEAAQAGALTQFIKAMAEQSHALERGIDDLAHARHEADAANLAKSQFLTNMSHELRTPLNAIIGYAELLQEDAMDAGDDVAVKDFDRILTAAKHLLSLIGDVLDLSKIEAGRMEMTPAPFDPAALVTELIETIRPAAEANGNTLSFSAPALQGHAITDATKLGQCVLNLLSNAAKFTQNGLIDVRLDRKPLNGVDQFHLTVSDTGIGMTKEHVARLFQPFVQADPSIMARYGGTGLGLTITRRLAQLLGGDVTVTSVFGEGATFTLHIPCKLADAATARAAAAKIDDVQGAEGAPLVVVIEDEADARELAARALTRAGFAVQGAGGGEGGLALTRAKMPALVLLDIFLPDRSGWRVLQSLKQDPRTRDIPVVVLSVNEDRAHALALGAAAHVVKPADRDTLAATVMRYARRRPTPDRAFAVEQKARA